MGISSFIIGVVCGIILTSVGLLEIITILKEVVDEAIPVLSGLI